MARGCVIFDFDGVIADTERLHLQAYNEAMGKLAERIGGPLAITAEAYFAHYIVYSNREGFWHMLRDAGRPHDEGLVQALCAAKDVLFEERLHQFAEPLPGVRALLGWLEARRVPRAICSGAGRKEIEHLLGAFGVREHFDLIVSIEDVRQGKPDPEGYQLAFQRLQERYGRGLEKGLSLVIEDSAGGCKAARAAGIRVLGVATSLPEEQLQRCADHVVGDLSQMDYAALAQWLGEEER